MFDRSLLFLDTLLKQFINRGHIIESKRGSTKIVIQKQSIPIRLRESYNRVKKSNPKWFDSEDKVANGILCFQIDESYNRVEWKDSNSSKLEDKIPNIIAKIEDICYKRHREELERVREKVRKEEIYHLIQARKKVIEIHLSKFNKLLRETARHKKIMDMRSYIDSLKKYENGSPEMKEWIEWATSATNWYDPLVKFDHPYLKDVDRDTLSIKTLDSEIENWYNSYNTHDYGEDNEWDLNMEFMTEY